MVVRESEDKETINGVRQTKVIINRSEWNHMESVKKEVVADMFPHLNIKEEWKIKKQVTEKNLPMFG